MKISLPGTQILCDQLESLINILYLFRFAEDTKKIEHDYHHNQETLGIAIAKLEAKKEHLEEITSTDKTAYERIIKGKDEEIERLSGILEKMVENQPNAIIQVRD